MIIDQEFKSLNRKLNESEYKKLEASIIQEGVRDPLVLWNEILIDGHNRHAIANKHNISYSTVNNDDLVDREEVKSWIINNQLGRRNLTPNEVSYYRGKLYESLKRQGERSDITSGQNVHKSTSEEIAEKYGVSEKTIRRDAEFSKAVDKVEAEAGVDIKEAILSGKANIPKKNVEDVIKIKREAPELMPKLESGEMSAYQAVKQIEHKKLKEIKKQEVIELEDNRPTIEYCDAVEWIVGQYECDLLITDPPYKTDVENIWTFSRDWLPYALDTVKDTGRAYICIGPYPVELAAYLSIKPPEHLTLENILVWTYRNTIGPSPTYDYKNNWQAILYYRGVSAPPLNCPVMLEQFTVQDISAPDGRQGDRFHKWQKPDELARRLISHSTKEGDIVLDPFAGTGTFLIAASKMGRTAKGCDLSREMLDIAKDRGCKIA